METESEFAKNAIDDLLEGWAGIAAALGCSVRTAQRWTKAGRFSVYKVPGAKPSQVYARRAEVRRWKEQMRLQHLGAPEVTAVAQDASANASRHDSYIWGWKAIAHLMNMSVRTVQRWEREGKLPVRRLESGTRATPYVLQSELSTWIHGGTTSRLTVAEMDKKLPILMHSFLDALTAHVAVLDKTGTITAVNKAWRSFTRANGFREPNCGVGKSYLEVCSPAACVDAVTASLVAAGLGELLEGKRHELKAKYQCGCPPEQRDFLLSATRFDGLSSPFFVLFHSDVTNVL